MRPGLGGCSIFSGSGIDGDSSRRHGFRMVRIPAPKSVLKFYRAAKAYRHVPLVLQQEALRQRLCRFHQYIGCHVPARPGGAFSAVGASGVSAHGMAMNLPRFPCPCLFITQPRVTSRA